jgi:hypothetical protein
MNDRIVGRSFADSNMHHIDMSGLFVRHGGAPPTSLVPTCFAWECCACAPSDQAFRHSPVFDGMHAEALARDESPISGRRRGRSSPNSGDGGRCRTHPRGPSPARRRPPKRSGRRPACALALCLCREIAELFGKLSRAGDFGFSRNIAVRGHLQMRYHGSGVVIARAECA